MPKSTSISKQIDKKKGAKRKVVGPDEYRRKRANQGTTSDILPSYDKPREAQAEAVITEPATDEAKQWSGWGSGLKPTFEPILVFRKPLIGTLTENVLTHGTGALNINATRVKHSSPEDFEQHKAGVEAIKARGGSMDNSWKNSSDLSGANDVTSAGRWPPNVLMTHVKYEWWTLRRETPIDATRAILAYYGAEQALSAMRNPDLGDAREAQKAEVLLKDLRGSVSRGKPQDRVEGASLSAVRESVRSDTRMGSERTTEVLFQKMPHAGEYTIGAVESFGQTAYNRVLGQDEGGVHREVCPRAIVPVEGRALYLQRWVRIRYDLNSTGDPADLCARNAQGQLQQDVHPGASDCCGDTTGASTSEDRRSSSLKRGQGGQSAGESRSGESVRAQQVTSLDRDGTSGTTTGSRVAAGGEPKLEVAAWLVPSGWSQFFELACIEGCVHKGVKEAKAITGGKNPHANPAPVSELQNGPFKEKQNRPYTNYASEDGTETVEAWECVPGCPVKELDEQSGQRTSGTGAVKRQTSAGYKGDTYGAENRAEGTEMISYGDTGGASRFYPQFEGQEPVEVPFFYTGKATKKETSLEGEIKNDHPTRKPLKLMQWLVRLVTPKGGLTIDPYCGSGSTLHAAVEEGMRFTGIEKDPHSHEIASKRMAIVMGRAEERQGQRDLFDLAMSLDD